MQARGIRSVSDPDHRDGRFDALTDAALLDSRARCAP
jgi:hypothetical protein